MVFPRHSNNCPVKGMTTRDSQEIVKDLYGVDVSPTLISEITMDLDEEVKAWRTRPLDPVWPIVYFDGIVVHVRGDNGRVSQHTIYVALGVNLEGHKELLGLWLSETEGAKFWLSCMTDLKNRGVRDIFITCVDGLAGFPEAIRAAFPEAKVQLCIVHLVRAAGPKPNQPLMFRRYLAATVQSESDVCCDRGESFLEFCDLNALR